jgi:uncharacterized membrane protein YuzA (DUF378 family)
MKGFLGMTAWLLTIIGALNWGLDAIGWNLFYTPLLLWMTPTGIYAFKIAVGVAGLFSLILFLGSLFSKHSCECCKK